MTEMQNTDTMQIARIREMEDRLDTLQKAVDELSKALMQYRKLLPEREKLIAYYESEDWMKDYADDAAGKIPKDLKRGVLSQDAVYDLLSDDAALREMAAELFGEK